MTKHRLMLSAATAALLAAPFMVTPGRADTTITTTQKSGINTTTDGNITIQSGGVEIKAASPAVIINSNNFLSNAGSISNADTAGAIGVQVDTSAGNIVNSSGIVNLGAISSDGQRHRQGRHLHFRGQHLLRADHAGHHHHLGGQQQQRQRVLRRGGGRRQQYLHLAAGHHDRR